MTWKFHINKLIAKCMKKMHILSLIISKSHGPTIKTSVLLYKMLIRPCIEYGSPIFCSSLNDQLFNKLNSIQRSFNKLCLWSLSTTPHISLNIMTSLHPLRSRFNDLSFRLLNQCITAPPNHNLSIVLQNYQTKYMNRSNYTVEFDNHLFFICILYTSSTI